MCWGSGWQRVNALGMVVHCCPGGIRMLGGGCWGGGGDTMVGWLGVNVKVVKELIYWDSKLAGKGLTGGGW